MVRFSHHAERRLAERGITRADVESVLENAHTTYTDDNGNPCSVGDVGERTIKVVVAANDPDFVITTYEQTPEEGEDSDANNG